MLKIKDTVDDAVSFENLEFIVKFLVRVWCGKNYILSESDIPIVKFSS